MNEEFVPKRPHSVSCRKGRTTGTTVACEPQVREDATQKYRGTINRYLASIGKDWDVELRLDHRGICSFQCGSFVIAVEVPWDSKVFFLYTSIMKCLSSSTAVMRKALELNYLTQATNSCTLAIDPIKKYDLEIMLCRTQRIDGSSPAHLMSLVKTFLQTATSVQKQLDRAHRSKLSIIHPMPAVRSKKRTNTRKGKESAKKQPPPPPRARDSTPTISNKTTDKSGLQDKRCTSKTLQKKVLFSDYSGKMNAALGLTTAGNTGYVAYSSKAPQSRGVMRRLSRMASKTLPRPRASLSRNSDALSPSEKIIPEGPLGSYLPTSVEI